MVPQPHDDLRAHRDWLLDFIQLPAGGTVVDLGCGVGDDLLALAARHPDPAARFLGIDAAASGLAAATARAEGDPRIGFCRHHLAGAVPLPDASVDAVFSHNLLECLADPDAFAREAARILRPGGVAVMAHWDFDSQLFDGSDRPCAGWCTRSRTGSSRGWSTRTGGWAGASAACSRGRDGSRGPSMRA